MYLGSGGVARIPLNICDQAQNNCIIKGRWSGGARRQEEPQSLKRKGWEIDVNPLQDILRLVLDARAWPGGALHRPDQTRKCPSQWEIGFTAWELMCTAGNVTMRKRALLISPNNANNNRFALCLDEERLNWVCEGVWARGAATAGMGE